MLSFDDFSKQVEERWYEPHPAHRTLVFKHPLGNIIRLMYVGTDRMAEMKSMYAQFQLREKSYDRPLPPAS